MSGKRVLVLDDDPIARIIMREALEDAGYYVATLDRPAGIVDSLRAQQPDVIVTDMYMPGLTGAEAIALIRGLGYQTPIVIVTALVEHGDSLAGHRLVPKIRSEAAGNFPAELVAAVRELTEPR